MREIAVQVAPVIAIMPLLHRVRVVLREPVRERCDRPAFAGHFGGDALRDLAEHAIVDQDVDFRLAHHVDEAGSHHQAGHVGGLAGGGAAREADPGEALAPDRDVPPVARVSAAVDDPAALEHEVVWTTGPLSRFPPPFPHATTPSSATSAILILPMFS